MDTPLETGRGQGPRRDPVGTSPDPKRPAPGGKGPDKNGRPVRYPIQLKVNINPAMAASLQRVCQRWGVPEGIGARIAITQFLAQQDPQYRSE